MRLNLGILRTWLTRLAGYMAIINFGMIFYLFIVENTWFPWYVWIVMMISLISIILLVDVKLVMSKEFEYQSNKNPEWKKLTNAVRKVCNELNISYENEQ